MASWRRVMADKPCRLSFLYRRWYNSLGYAARASTASGSGRPVSSQVSEMVDGGSSRLSDGVRYMAARFFAAPVQARKREEPKDIHGPRLNEAITSKYIRLVSDEGHAVVSREEALDRARRLDLDLVEVQRTAKPPVCKIMDYHKVMYEKDTMEKMRAKTKSETTIRKGDFKEVRLKGKIEQKDIEVKAETVKGLIQRGYRVKCMALPPKQRGTEECDLGALLSRLTDLIEDVIIVESGPFVEKQQAYVVVRHVKFGSKKGSRKAASKTAEMTSETERVASSTPVALDSAGIDVEAVEPININEETEDEILSDPESDGHGLPSSATTTSSRNVDGSSSWTAMMSDMTEKSPGSKAVYNSREGNWKSGRDQLDRHVPLKSTFSGQEFSAEDSNRYSRRVDMKLRTDRREPGGRNGRVPEVKGTPESSGFYSVSDPNRFSRSPPMRNSRLVEQQRPNQGNISRQTPAYESQRQGHLDSIQGQIRPGDSSPVSSYGIFSSTKPSTSGLPRMADVDGNREKSTPNSNTLNTPKSEIETTVQNDDKMKKGGWGVFSRPISDTNQDQKFGQR